MKRWSNALGQEIEYPNIDAFLADIWRVCELHGFGLSHEDGHGAFEVLAVGDANREWLMGAHDGTRSVVTVLGDLHVRDGAVGIRTSQLPAPVSVGTLKVSGAGSVGIDMDDEPEEQ